MKTTWTGRTLSALLAAAMLTGSWAGAYSQEGYGPDEAALYSEAGGIREQSSAGKADDFYAAVNAKVLEEHKVGENGGSYLENILQIRREASEKGYDAYGEPVDREVWNLLPQEMNPCYYPTDNSINIPVAALEAPYFSINAQEEVNLGALGTIVAHEITHAFDDLGSKYDENGDYVDWWTKKDREEYEKRAERIVTYYNHYKTPGAPPTDGKQNEHVNEGEFLHQWCRINVDGVYWICDPYGMYVGPEPGEYLHPFFYKG